MLSYNERQKRLLLKAYKIDAEGILDRADMALKRGDTDTALALVCRAVPKVKKALAVKADLREIRRKQNALRRAAKYNLYAGGSLNVF